MTNQSKPDRQDGDGLLPCPFCGGTDLHSYREQSAIGSWVSCHSCGLESPTETGVTLEQAIVYWNTRATPQPTPDAAEGATFTVSDEDWDRALGTAYSCLEAPYLSLADFDNAMQHAFGMLSLRKSAPPKPAPDAVREAGIRLWNAAKAVALYRPLAKQVCHVPSALMHELIDALVASSAPVPSPDRQISTLHKFVASQQDIDPEVRDQICGMIAGLSVAVSSPDWASGRDAGLAEAMFGIPPSPAVAAEPVAWSPGQSIDARARKLLEVELDADPVQPTMAAIRAISVALQGEAECIDALRAVWNDWVIANDESGGEEYEIKDVAPETIQIVQRALCGRLYATPPVRGGREAIVPKAIAEAFSDWAWNKKGEAIGNMLSHEAAKVSFFAGAQWADALSLPVQSTFRPDKEAAAQVIAKRMFGEKLEDLESLTRDNCRDTVTEIFELAGIQSGAGEREEDSVRICDCDPARTNHPCTCERAVHEDGT